MIEKSAKEAKVKLVASLIYRERDRLSLAEGFLEDIFGPTEELEKTAPFDYTDYYAKEFGSPLARKIIVFKKTVPLDTAHLSKVSSILLEKKMSIEGKRTVNIDPGYVTEAKLVLFSTKDYTHRLYSGDGIFSECTLFFRDGVFNAWPWTYPDYASTEMREFFGKVRDIYSGELRQKYKGKK
jgi:hypothetical protein